MLQCQSGTCGSCRPHDFEHGWLRTLKCRVCISWHAHTHNTSLTFTLPSSRIMQAYRSIPSSTRCACGHSRQPPRNSACRATIRGVQHVELSAQQQQSSEDAMNVASRRGAIWTLASVVALAVQQTSQAGAVGFNKELKKRKLRPEDYTENADVGLRIYELEEGRNGQPIGIGDTVVVHYDCVYRGLDVVSSRSARLLGGNRTIAEPYEFVVGEPVSGVALRKINETANGMFAGVGGPKPPAALSKAVVGMKKGGKRSLLVDVPELGFPKGLQEIPPGGIFELKVEVLDITKRA